MEKPDKPRTNRFEAKEMEKFDNILMDTSHVGTAELNLIDFFDTLADKINYIHFSDNNPKIHKDRPNSLEDRHLAPGKGKLPLEKFLRHLKKSGYKGIISIELIPDSIEAEKGEKMAIKNLQKAREFVEKYFS
jgi:sugar phosphate isomerase/epimerase